MRSRFCSLIAGGGAPGRRRPTPSSRRTRRCRRPRERRSRRRRSAGAARSIGASSVAATALIWPRWRRIGQGDGRPVEGAVAVAEDDDAALSRSSRRRSSKRPAGVDARAATPRRSRGAARTLAPASREPGAGEAARIDPAARPGSARRATTAARRRGGSRRRDRAPRRSRRAALARRSRRCISASSRRGLDAEQSGDAAAHAVPQRSPRARQRRRRRPRRDESARAGRRRDGRRRGRARRRCPEPSLGDRRAALDDERSNAALGERAGQRAAGEAGADDDHRRGASAVASCADRADSVWPAPRGAAIEVDPRRGDGRGAKRGAKRPRVMSRLPPLPGAFSTAKPALRRPSRTARAALQVATVASGAASRAIALNRRASHIAGLRAGAKPSRKKASTSRDQLRQPGVDGAEREQQLDAAAVEGDAVQVAGERRPLRAPARRPAARATRSRSSDAKVGARRRRRLDRDEVELSAALRIGAPRGPGGEEVVAEAEAGLEDDEAVACRASARRARRRRGRRGAPARARPSAGGRRRRTRPIAACRRRR